MSDAMATIAAIAAPDFRGTLFGTAGDGTGSLRVTVGPAGRMSSAEVLGLPRELKAAATFREALLDTCRAAEAARLLAEVEHSGALEQLSRAPAEATAPLPRIPSGAQRRIALRAPDEQADAYHRYVNEGLEETPVRRGLTWGSSDNRYLRLGFASGGRLRAVEVDESWLESARPEQLTRALTEALSDEA